MYVRRRELGDRSITSNFLENVEYNGQVISKQARTLAIYLMYRA